MRRTIIRSMLVAAIAATGAGAQTKPGLASPPAAQPRAADPELLDLSTAENVAAALQQLGYRGLVKKEADGSAYVESSANGQAFTIDLYDCKDGRCGALQFQSFYKSEPLFTLALVNDWNSDKRFLKVTVAKDGKLREWLDVSVVGKLTRANFADVIDWYGQLDSSLAKFLTDRRAAAAPKS